MVRGGVPGRVPGQRVADVISVGTADHDVVGAARRRTRGGHGDGVAPSVVTRARHVHDVTGHRADPPGCVEESIAALGFGGKAGVPVEILHEGQVARASRLQVPVETPGGETRRGGPARGRAGRRRRHARRTAGVRATECPVRAHLAPRTSNVGASLEEVIRAEAEHAKRQDARRGYHSDEPGSVGIKRPAAASAPVGFKLACGKHHVRRDDRSGRRPGD